MAKITIEFSEEDTAAVKRFVLSESFLKSFAEGVIYAMAKKQEAEGSHAEVKSE